MNEENTFYRPKILPITQENARPLWSVMIPTYNCADYLRETLSSVLVQDIGLEQMQIEVIDDYSTKDDPQAVVEELGQGRVKFYRQPQNMGYIRNFETCLQRSQGQFIHILHGDDAVREGFYETLQKPLQQYPDIGAVFCRHIYMDEKSHWQSISELEQEESGIFPRFLEKIAQGQRLVTPSIVVRRSVYEKLGGFDRRFTCCGEDWEMWLRIATKYPIYYEIQPLALYRVKRPHSLTQNAVNSHKLVKDMRLATEIIESYLPQYLPSETVQQLTAKARLTYGFWALEPVTTLVAQGNLKEAIQNLQEALKCSHSPLIYRQAIVALGQGLLKGVKSFKIKRSNLKKDNHPE